MTKTWPETEARTAEDPRNADDRGAIADRIVERSKVANDRLAPLVLASLMSTAPVCTRDHNATVPQSAEGVARQREVPVDDLLADPMMSALWQAYAISAADVRRLVTDVTDRLRSGGELHRRAEALIARCA
ncbi:MAG TPA: hypothetical protein VL462_00380 [Candidatus Nitrosotalea sp.]|jgi:hypothetical protein|nr:hypothetical protein [Candidatus Nitrosotalea sp.]